MTRGARDAPVAEEGTVYVVDEAAESASSTGGDVPNRSIVVGMLGMYGVCGTSSWAPESPKSGGGVRGLGG